MNHFLPFSNLSLRVKLVLSYLAVALGAIFFLAFAISIATSLYFEAQQRDNLRRLADEYQTNLIDRTYLENGGVLDGPGLNRAMVSVPDPAFVYVIAPNDTPLLCAGPLFLNGSNCQSDTVQSALKQALQENKTIEGDFNIAVQKSKHGPNQNQGPDQDQEGSASPPMMVNTAYVALPVVEDGKTIGAMFLAQPQPPDRTPYPFLSEVDRTIFLSGIVISLAVVLISFLLAKRFTRPIEVLTDAAEQMKRGKYTERVPAPQAQDELGLLAQTFNEMADTIEADVNELRRQEQFRRDLIANIAHDLVTPLTAIQGFSEAMADDIISGQEARVETAQRIGREVQRLRRLVADMRNMTSLESGRTQLDLAPLDMYSLVDETLVVIEAECERAGISLKNTIDPSTPLVMADSDRIAQVLLNLLDNARRHTPQEGSIQVGAAVDKGMLNIWIRDTGVGIDAKDLPYIFERFYRADRSRAAATGGSGLGLAIVKAIINAHHGIIWAQSAPGQGTIITFRLPLAQVQSKQEPPTQKLPPLGPQGDRPSNPDLENTGKSRRIGATRLTKLAQRDSMVGT
jgi:two-component system sensor histidine kinase BaeS